MCHPRRGVALIFNHQNFNWISARSGSDKDCKELSSELRCLGFDIEVHHDLSYAKLSQVLMEST